MSNSLLTSHTINLITFFYNTRLSRTATGEYMKVWKMEGEVSVF